MSRPRKTLTDEQVEQVERLAAVLTLDQLADFFGMSGNTFRARMLDDPRILARYKRGKAQALASAGGSLLSLVRKQNLGAICFYLKTQGTWRETTHADLDVDALDFAQPSAWLTLLGAAAKQVAKLPADPRTAAVLAQLAGASRQVVEQSVIERLDKLEAALQAQPPHASNGATMRVVARVPPGVPR